MGCLHGEFTGSLRVTSKQDIDRRQASVTGQSPRRYLSLVLPQQQALRCRLVSAIVGFGELPRLTFVRLPRRRLEKAKGLYVPGICISVFARELDFLAHLTCRRRGLLALFR